MIFVLKLDNCFRNSIMAMLIFACGCLFLPSYGESKQYTDKQIREVLVKENCDRKNVPASTLLLIDTTDTIKEEQLQFVLDNFARDMEWQNKGERFTVVALNDTPVSILPYISFCTPKPEGQIDPVFDTPGLIKAHNIWFAQQVHESIKEIVSKHGKADAENTFLIEAITEVYRNKRYHLTNATTRKLILISDLYQHSKIISFFRDCKSKTFKKRPLTCPSLTKTKLKNDRFRNYLREAMPKLGLKDTVTIYYLNVDGRVDRSGEVWWREYFSFSGLPKSNITIIPELQN